MKKESGLPPGQCETKEFPRFGATRFADRFPQETRTIRLQILGAMEHPLTICDELRELPRVTQTSDFHCVTTWTCRSLHWSGVRFAEFFNRIVVPLARPGRDVAFVVLRCQDGYRTALPLSDLLAPDVLLADRLNGEPLSIAHGAPLRLVAPAHYGYKNAKHVDRIEFRRDDSGYRPVGPRFMDHPRARVALEERGRGIPGRLLRYLYRPLIRPTVIRFRRAMEQRSQAPLP